MPHLAKKRKIKYLIISNKPGPVVRITPNLLSFSDHRAIKTIYGRGPGAFSKGDQFGDGFLPGGDPPVFFAKESAVHSRVRKRVAHAVSFHPETLIRKNTGH